VRTYIFVKYFLSCRLVLPASCTVASEVKCGVVWCGVVWCGVVWCGVVCLEREERGNGVLLSVSKFLA
jgi:hypothetical protein